MLYENIYSACSRRGITIYRMCKDIGIRNAILSDLKMGRANSLRADTLDKIATYLGVSHSELLGTLPAEQSGRIDAMDEYRQALKDRPEMKTLFDKAKGATKEQLEAIVNMLDVMQGNRND